MKARLLAENFAMKEKIKDDSVLRTRHIEVIHMPFVVMYFLLAVATHQCKFASERKMEKNCGEILFRKFFGWVKYGRTEGELPT